MPQSTSKSGNAQKSDGLDLKLKHSFGIHGPIRDNLFLIESVDALGHTDEHVIFPVGTHVVMFQPNNNSMDFFEGTRSSVRCITALALSPNKKYLAVCEQCRAGDAPQMTFFKVSSRKHLRTFSHQHKSETFVSACFSGDSKLLITVSKDAIEVWCWEKEKIEFTSNLYGDVNKVCCPRVSTSSDPLISTSGLGHLRFWSSPSSNERLSNSMVMPSQSKEQQYDFADHTWLTEERDKIPRMAVVMEHTSTAATKGTISQPDGGKIDVSVEIYQLHENEQRSYLEAEQSLSITSQLDGTHVYTISPLSRSRGFMLGGNNGFFSFYEPKHERRGLCSFSNTKMISEVSRNDVFTSICTTSEDDQAILFSEAMRLVKYSIDNTTNEDSFLDLLPKGLHHGTILEMDCAVQRPLFVTCGKDKSIRIWNYRTKRCDVAHYFEDEEPLTVTFHPCGYQVLVGFKERIRLYNVIIEDVALYKEMSCKSCRKVRFSPGGNVFAATLGNTIALYSTYNPGSDSTFQLLHSFRGHAGPVNNLSWDRNEYILYSTGLDGSVYGWDLRNGERIDDMNVLFRQNSYVGLVVDPSRKGEKSFRAVVCGTDGKLFDVVCKGGTNAVPKIKQVADKITSICFSADHRILLAGTSGGCIRLYEWPLGETPSFQEFSLHSASAYNIKGRSQRSAAVTCIQATKYHVISAGEDGSIFVSAIHTFKRGLSVELRPHSKSFNDNVVLVSSEAYHEQKDQISELNRRIVTMNRDHEFALHSKDSMWQNELKEFTAKTDVLLEGERKRFEELQNKHEETIQRHVKHLERKDKKHSDTMNELENHYEHRLAMEVERFDKLETDMEKLKKDCNQSLVSQEEEHTKKLRVIAQNTEKKEKKLNAALVGMKEEAHDTEKIFKEILDQQEEEYELELMQLMARAEDKLHIEHGNIQKIRGIVQSVNSKRDQLHRHNQELKSKAQNYEDAQNKEKAQRRDLEGELEQMKRMLAKKDDALKDMETNLKDLQSDKSMLENIRYVHENQLNELKEERGPMDEKISVLNREIIDLNDRLERSSKEKESKERTIEEKDLKLKAHEREITSVRGKLRERERELHSVKGEFSSLAEMSSEKGLRDAVKVAYHKHVKNSCDKTRGKLNVSKGGMQSAPSEHASDEINNKLKEAEERIIKLEKHNKEVKRRSDMEVKSAKRSVSNKIAENTELLKECKLLRDENKTLKKEKYSLSQQLSSAR